MVDTAPTPDLKNTASQIQIADSMQLDKSEQGMDEPASAFRKCISHVVHKMASLWMALNFVFKNAP